MAGFKAGDPKPVTGPIAKDVAAGYSETLTAYLAWRTEDNAVKAANKGLDALLTDDDDDDEQTSKITAARETLAAAQVKQTAARSALDSVGAGPINTLGIAEWQAKFAVEDAVTAWNTAVSELVTAKKDLDPLDYAKYVPLRDIAQIDGMIDENDNVNLVNLRRYANAAGDNSAVQDAETGAIADGPGALNGGEDDTTGNFDAAGNLLVPMEVFDHDDDSDTANALGPARRSMTYLEVNTRLASVTKTVAALKEFKDESTNSEGESTNPLLAPAVDVAIQRAEAEQAYYQGQFNAMVADNTDQKDQVDDVQSLKTHYATFSTAETARDNKGVGLKKAFDAREAATSAVVAAFTDPQAFYQQLVNRREYTKAQKEAEVTRLADLTGDDAATEAQTEAAADDVTAATTALEAAETAQAAFQDLVADDSPVKALVEELLKPDAIGDDGGALVDAIAGAYEGQDAANTRLDELLKETTMTTTQLDADGDAVTDADGIPVTTSTTTESGRIVDIEGRIAGLTGEDGAVSMNTGRIVQNGADIETLDGRVTVNRGRHRNP